MLFGLEVEAVQRQIVELTAMLARPASAAAELAGRWPGELDVVRVLVGMDDAGWHVLPDRRWPGTRRANIDVLLVGPGGVFVVDVKAWREVRLEGDRLWRGDADVDDEVRTLAHQAEPVETLLAAEGLPPTEVVPLLVLAGRRNARGALGRVLVTGERDLTLDLMRRGVRLPPEVVERLVEVLDRTCPPMSARPPDAAPARARRRPVEPVGSRPSRRR